MDLVDINLPLSSDPLAGSPLDLLPGPTTTTGAAVAALAIDRMNGFLSGKTIAALLASAAIGAAALAFFSLRSRFKGHRPRSAL